MKIYEGKYTKEIVMPVGGIGTGCIGIDGAGRLRDWEIFNRPNMGSINGRSHFAVRAIKDGKIVSAKVLAGDLRKDYNGVGNGADNRMMVGFPHFKNTKFINKFPMGAIEFSDDGFPGRILMEVFSPMIPGDNENSSLPAALCRINFVNETEENLEYTAALSVKNPFPKAKNIFYKKEKVKMIMLKNDIDTEDPDYGDVTISSRSVTSMQQYWYRGGWQDPVVTYWREFTEQRELKDRYYEEGYFPEDTATILCNIKVEKNTTGHVDFVISWNVPKVVKYWDVWDQNLPKEKMEYNREHAWKNYYTKNFANSTESAIYACNKFQYLKDKTEEFASVLHNTTVPPEVTDAVTSNISVLSTPTVLRLSDGSFYGWEGVWQNGGSCEGTCQHVWNYAYALCFLFPELEKSIRELEFKYCLCEDGKDTFRIIIPPEKNSKWDFRACVDGQMGAIIKTYREWKLSGDDKWMRFHYKDLKKMLDYATSPDNPDKWDLNADGVLEGRQHHTLDMELFGPSGWLQGFYLAALKAFSETAAYFGYRDDAQKYKELFEKGSKWTEENLFNGKYYIQKVDLKDKKITEDFGASEDYFNNEKGEIKYQIGEGCEIDQLLAQWHANILGLGDIFNRENRKKALKSLYKNNFKKSMREFANPWRVYSLNDEKAAVICDYPEGVYKPVIPIPYCEETMNGFEYSLAGLLISEGFMKEGLEIVKAVRERYDGYKRNPFNEVECGNHYARSMASFALIPICSGYGFDLSAGHISFEPKFGADNDSYSTFFATGTGWGEFKLSESEAKIIFLSGKASLKSVKVPLHNVSEVIINGTNAAFETDSQGNITFERTNVKKIIIR